MSAVFLFGIACWLLDAYVRREAKRGDTPRNGAKR